MFSTGLSCLFKILWFSSVHASMYYLGEAKGYIVLCCQIGSNMRGRAHFIFIF